MKSFLTEEDFATARDAALDVIENYHDRLYLAMPTELRTRMAMDIVSAIARSDTPIGDITDLPGVEVNRGT